MILQAIIFAENMIWKNKRHIFYDDIKRSWMAYNYILDV